MNDIKEESCLALKMGLRHAICGLSVGEGEVVYALSATSKRLLTFTLVEPDKKLKKVRLYTLYTLCILCFNIEFSTHLTYCVVRLSVKYTSKA